MAYYAQAWAEQNNATTLEMTQVGQELASLGQGAHYPTYTLVQSASARFAESAQGMVHVFQPYLQSGSYGSIGLDSVWATIEYPALVANPNVTGFVYHLVTDYGNIIEMTVTK